MKKMLLVLAVVALASPVWAINVLPNTKVVTINPPAPGEPSLQYLATGLGANPDGSDPVTGLKIPPVFPGSSLNVQTMQSMAGLFKPSSGVGTSTPTMWFEWTGGTANEFGMFSIGNGTIDRLAIFKGPAVGYSEYPGVLPNKATGASIGFNQDGTIDISGSDCTKVNCVADYAGVNPSAFGFYLFTNNMYIYTIDSLNVDGATRALRFQKPEAATEWLFAFEDGSDGDFQDVGVKVESIAAVPEPGSMMLLGTGLFGLAGAVRRRIKK